MPHPAGKWYAIERLRRAPRTALLVLAMLGATAGVARAQVAFGLNVGPSLTHISGSLIEDGHLTAGIYLGAIIDVQLGSRWALETGVSSVQKGAFSAKVAGEDGLWDLKTSYVQVPVRVKYLIPFAEERWVFAPFGGVAASLNGSCQIREAGFPLFDDDCTSETPGGPIEKHDILFSVGFAMDRVFGSSAFGFDLRYSRGIRNVFPEPSVNGLTSYNSTFDMKVRLIFPHFGGS